MHLPARSLALGMSGKIQIAREATVRRNPIIGILHARARENNPHKNIYTLYQPGFAFFKIHAC
jgi:hypothetical protein